MIRVAYTTEGGKKSTRIFYTEEEARDWIEVVKDRGWTARMSPTKKEEEPEVEEPKIEEPESDV